MYIFNDNGFAGWPSSPGYELQPGEVFFDHYPSEEDLRAAFPLRESIQLQAERDRLSLAGRKERDRLLREIYDAGTQMIRRELETSPLDPVYESKLIAKRTELHDYARALQGVPDQSEFPLTIVWPAIPTEELS